MVSFLRISFLSEIIYEAKLKKKKNLQLFY
jgi:hypothetical protein